MSITSSMAALGSSCWSPQKFRFTRESLIFNQFLSHLTLPSVPFTFTSFPPLSGEVSHLLPGWWQRELTSAVPSLAESQRWHCSYLGHQPVSSCPLVRAASLPHALWNSLESLWCSVPTKKNCKFPQRELLATVINSVPWLNNTMCR